MKARRTPFAELTKRYRKHIADSADFEDRDRQLAWFEKRFAGKSVADVTAAEVAEARDALTTEEYARGKGQGERRKRSGATVNRYLAALSHMFSIAQKEWNIVDLNPVRSVAKRKESRGRVRFLSDAELERLLEACAKSAWHPLRALVLLAVSTGGRRGELIGLKWSDVDLKQGTATLHNTKNGERRVLPLKGKALKALEAIRELKLNDSARSDFVFPAPSGLPDNFENFDRHWYDALDIAGIEDFKFHDLRHTCASYLAAQGATLLEIADVLGHKTTAMVKRYSHLATQHKASVIEKMVTAKGL